MDIYDVIVLGWRVGRRVHSLSRLAKGGKRAARVEERLVGGECSCFVCIPRKAMLAAVERADPWRSWRAPDEKRFPAVDPDNRVVARAKRARRRQRSNR